jgi:flagellar assembly protein FliH
VLRGETVTVLNYSTFGKTDGGPRLFGTRVLRGDNVGLQRPISLAAPVKPEPARMVEEVSQEVFEAAPSPPPDFAAIEEAARQQGYSVGFEEGRAAGLAAAEEASAEMLHRLVVVLEGIHENHTAFYRAAERQVVDLALQIAQKVVEREIENMPDLAVNVIRGALEEMDARTAIRVRVSPDDFELLQRRWTQVVPPGVGAERIELVLDERVLPGGGVIETSHGQVDAQLNTKLEQLGNALWTFVMDVNSTSADEVADA